jgi:hypothetical protein
MRKGSPIVAAMLAKPQPPSTAKPTGAPDAGCRSASASAPSAAPSAESLRPAAPPPLAERTARRDPVATSAPPIASPPPVSAPRPASVEVEAAVVAPVATVGAYATVGEAGYPEPPERAIPTWVLVFLAVCAVLFLLAMAVLAAVVWYVYLSDPGAAASLSLLRTSNGVV